MKYNPLIKIAEFGQSIWLDYLRRDMLESGELQGLIDNDGLRGMTSNPSIFWKAIDGSDDYTAAIRALSQQGRNQEEIYRTLTIEDVQKAADLFRPVYDESDGSDGFVSLEVNPHLARDVDGTIKEAKELWAQLNRPNVFIKVPATKEGLKCIRYLISEGINVNVTLLFGLDRYREVTEAYIAGLEDRLDNGDPIDKVNSVASFFLSRIDVKVDPQLEEIEKQKKENSEVAGQLKGKVAIASAKMAYQIYKEMFESDRFRNLEKKGAAPQRVLWASTSTKNPSYSDIKYVEALIGPHTVNTIPQTTLNAYRDHGEPAARIEDNIDDAKAVLKRLEQLGIDIDKVTQELVEEGIDKFNKPYDKTMESIDKRIEEARSEVIDAQKMLLGDYGDKVSSRIKTLAHDDFAKRLRDRDTSLWTKEEKVREQIGNSLGWLDVAEKMISAVPDLKRFVNDVKKSGIRHVVHLGMGGSSLAPLVFEQTLHPGSDGLPLRVLDSTDPDSVRKIADELPLDETMFIVASKSGTTTETITFMDYFYEQVRKSKGNRAGKNFVAITDPGSPLVDTARKRGFRVVFLNYADIGGRYSALSYFGMVPAALMGLDIEELLERAVRMAYANDSRQPDNPNPAIDLGAAIGELALQGRDKLTFLTSETISSLGLWLEQLIAESTGKQDKGILPVVENNIAKPGAYGKDRVFVYFELQDEKYDEDINKLDDLAAAGHPVIIIRLHDRYDIGQEMMRWEIATATAGAVIGINPFDQPNVQESKDITRRLLEAVTADGSLPEGASGKDANSRVVSLAKNEANIVDTLADFLSKAHDNDYLALQAYLPEEADTTELLQNMQNDLRHQLRCATTIGYGPRYLHSTGQFHKGGPNTGMFIQMTASPRKDIDAPGRNYSFGVLFKAQANGDFQALQKHGRRVLKIDLGDDATEGLRKIRDAITELSLQRT